MHIQIDLPKEAQAMLSSFAKEKKMSEKDFVENAILEYLEELSDFKEAYQSRKSRLNGEKGESWEDIKKELAI